MTDRELLELAAKAGYGRMGLDKDENWISSWDPLGSDSDAFRLALAVGISIDLGSEICAHAPGIVVYAIGVKNNPYSATRRAIVRAAAEIGKVMP